MPERGAPPNVHPLQRRILKAVRAFTSPLLPDDYLELINPLWSTRELRGRIEKIEPETPDAATVVIRPGYEWDGHEPGQYLRIGLDINGRRHWRAYSLTSDPDRPDGCISITIKNVDEGVVSPWDSASTAEAWKHSHNYIHHTYTNIRGKDRDLGYEIMRIDPQQKWHPVYLFQPLYNLVLMAFFEWGVATHDLDFDAIRAGDKEWPAVKRELKGMAGKAKDQIVKDYVAFPALSGLLMTAIDPAIASRRAGPARASFRERPGLAARQTVEGVWGKAKRKTGHESVLRQLVERRSFRRPFRATVTADFTANIVRNVWAHAIIFCGHFPDQTYTFSQPETDEETRGGRYVRQLLGAANIEGSPLFHVISGNLGYQVEHHLYPDMPSTRYGEIAPRVREICERYELPYNTGPFFQQWGMVMRTIARLAFPGGGPGPKPGPYRGEKVKNEGEQQAVELSAAA